MNGRTKILAFLGVLIFSIGVLVGLALFSGAAWGDLEGFLFHSTTRGDSSLRSLRCPVFLTSAESGAIRARFSNPLERSTEFAVRTYISEGFVSMLREIREQLPLEPGESKQLEWPVTPDDAAYGRVILARVHVRGGYPLPSRHASCGILVLDVPSLTGGQILALALTASLLCMGLGAGLWIATHRPLAGRSLDVVRAMGALAVTVVVGIVVSLLGMWVLGLLAVVVTILLTGAIIGYRLTRSPAASSPFA
jgi:ABC-type multidrug transport system fused ATPase/permease subunit